MTTRRPISKPVVRVKIMIINNCINNYIGENRECLICPEEKGESSLQASFITSPLHHRLVSSARLSDYRTTNGNINFHGVHPVRVSDDTGFCR